VLTPCLGRVCGSLWSWLPLSPVARCCRSITSGQKRLGARSTLPQRCSDHPLWGGRRGSTSAAAQARWRCAKETPEGETGPAWLRTLPSGLWSGAGDATGTTFGNSFPPSLPWERQRECCWLASPSGWDAPSPQGIARPNGSPRGVSMQFLNCSEIIHCVILCLSKSEYCEKRGEMRGKVNSVAVRTASLGNGAACSHTHCSYPGKTFQ